MPSLNGREIKALLQGELIERGPWAAATMKLQTGEELYIREARIEAAWVAVHEFREVVVAGHGFSDIVGAGVDVERLGRYRKRIQDPHVLIGMIGGKLAGLVHGRLMHEDITISHPTMTFDRGRPPGAALFQCEVYNALEILGQKGFGPPPRATMAGGSASWEWRSPLPLAGCAA